MISIKIKDLEKRLERRIKRNIISLGIDPASRTGWCSAITDKDTVIFDYGFIDVKSKDVFFKYNQLINYFTDLFSIFKSKDCEKIVVIEDVFFGKNINTLKMLARIGMIAYVLSHQKNLPRTYILASTARSSLGFKGTSKKPEVHYEIKNKLKIDLNDEDATDALILSLIGIVEEKGLSL